ncbi:hypothetical protein BTO30_01475 [Domibacillus antri]|uniref:Uncharacterized protein n=1 Tax=Domibacillus antri TaxID=1714264 RepID=A0A1Q8Q9X8_9BACI|nr:hypothetical protein [Domibacillus antri]OLN24111.1 hypothetical protein BTO30_01475 [Domibacillus antri]
MYSLDKRLRGKLLENSAVQIKDSAIWRLPVATYDVAFKRAKRAKIDILMKMMLLSFQETVIRRAANLSEMLLVEELFIADLIEKMQRMGLICLEKEGFKLTEKGHEQLAKGFVEEEMEEESTEMVYSPVHDAFWPALAKLHEAEKEEEEDMPLYRYANERSATTDHILQSLAEWENAIGEDGFQIVIARITHTEERPVEYVPCLEFRLYNQEQDTFYARVWNVALERWDEALEQQIEEQERVDWREKYLECESEETSQ